jgi:hypothetical protein
MGLQMHASGEDKSNRSRNGVEEAPRAWRALAALFAFVAWGAVWPACHAAGAGDARLTATEMRWLQAAWPVLKFARDAGLPVDVVVQPQPAPELPPMAMAWVGERCKFVLSLRENPDVPATDARIEPELYDAAMQLMAAHELGHCTRHVRGEWLAEADSSTGLVPPLATQREEAYADLVGLAWTQRHHAALYGRVHAWLVSERLLSRQRGPGHDTLAWANLAARADRFGSRSVFAEADALWRQAAASAD